MKSLDVRRLAVAIIFIGCILLVALAGSFCWLFRDSCSVSCGNARGYGSLINAIDVQYDQSNPSNRVVSIIFSGCAVSDRTILCVEHAGDTNASLRVINGLETLFRINTD